MASPDSLSALSARPPPPSPRCTARSGRRPAASLRHTRTSWVGTEGQIGAVNEESWVAVDLSDDLSGADAGVAIKKIKGILLHPYRYATIPWFKCCCCKLLSPNTPHCKLLLPLQFKCSAWTMAIGWPCHGQAPRRRPVPSPAASVLLGRTCPSRRRRGVVRLSSRLAYTSRTWPRLDRRRARCRSSPFNMTAFLSCMPGWSLA
jgi:hypothetical protein